MIVKHLLGFTAACLTLTFASVHGGHGVIGGLQAGSKDPLTRRLAAAEAQGKIIPITQFGGALPVIDGSLSDWGALDPRTGCIVQGIDDVPAFRSAKPKGAAVYSLRADTESLYIAVRVLDASVRPLDPIYLGDSVQLFFDARPLSGAAHTLGDPAYSEGAMQLIVAAPTPGQTTLHWTGGGQKTASIGPFEIAGRSLADGYTLEIRVPFTSVPGLSRERLQQPIGFDIYVGDVDAAGDTGVATTPRAEYSLSGTDDGWQDLSTLKFAQAGPVTLPPPPFIRALPARYSEGVASRRIEAGLLTTTEATLDQSRIEVRYHTSGAREEAAPPIERHATMDYPQLGIRVHQHILDLQALSRGRYTVETHYPGLPLADDTTEFDAITWHSAAPDAADTRRSMGPLPDHSDVRGAMRLPNGWKLSPAGRVLPLPGDMPQRLISTPDGKYLFASTAGYHNHGISVIDTATWRVVQNVDLGKAWTGMAFATGTGDLYVSGGSVAATERGSGSLVFANAVHHLVWRKGRLERKPGIDLPAGHGQTAFIAGIAAAADGRIYVVDTAQDNVMLLDTARKVTAVTRVGYRPNAIALAPNRQELVVANWGDRSVSYLDARSLRFTRQIAVGSHPFDLAFGPDGRLFVTNAGSNSVSIIRNGAVVETVKTSLGPRDPVGSTPGGLAIAPDGHRLFVANADNNDVAVIDIARPGDARVMGFVPTGWYPSAVALSSLGDQLYVATGKGMSFRGNSGGEYIGTLLHGHVSVLPVPDSDSLAKYTAQVIANTPAGNAETQPHGMPTPPLSALRKIKHVLYIIRENRTYDQVFGDISRGNGDPGLTLFGRDATPNAHALAHDYILLDNLYCNGEVSEDGHEWCNAAYATDFTQRAWPNSYSDRGEPDADERLTASPAGYLWDNCARHGLSYYSYGEFASFKSSPQSPPVFSGSKRLNGHSSAAWSQYSFDRHDTEKMSVFMADLQKAETTGTWPHFIVMSLGEDHTQGTTPGKYTPLAHVAANDQALGQIVDAVSHSAFWPETAIFVIEDDAQNGPDHVDAHRTVGMVISPWIRRGSLDSTFYTTASFVRTMELILGLPPMTQYDAAATPLTSNFVERPNFNAYKNLKPRVDLEARNGTAAPGAAASARLDFSAYDRASPAALNHILWESLRPGTPYPAPVTGAPGLREVFGNLRKLVRSRR